MNEAFNNFFGDGVLYIKVGLVFFVATAICSVINLIWQKHIDKKLCQTIRRRGLMNEALLEYLEDLYNKGRLTDEEWFDLKNLIEEGKDNER